MVTVNSKPVLYYSKYCDYSSAILQYISHSKVKNDIFFVNIDNRYDHNGEIMIKLNDKTHIPLPNVIKSVPSLLILENNPTSNPDVIIGDKIKEYVFEQCKGYDDQATGFQGEPEGYSFFDGVSSVVSDMYSFLDQSVEDLSAKGMGGMRQMYNYASIDYNGLIDTPEENYSSEKIGEISLDKLIAKRDMEVPQNEMPSDVLPRR